MSGSGDVSRPDQQEPHDLHRYRFVETAAAEPAPELTLCNREGAAELGVELRPEDDKLVLYRPETARQELVEWATLMREAGHHVEGLPAGGNCGIRESAEGYRVACTIGDCTFRSGPWELRAGLASCAQAPGAGAVNPRLGTRGHPQGYRALPGLPFACGVHLAEDGWHVRCEAEDCGFEAGPWRDRGLAPRSRSRHLAHAHPWSAS
jgi:hypothetical protein